MDRKAVIAAGAGAAASLALLGLWRYIDAAHSTNDKEALLVELQKTKKALAEANELLSAAAAAAPAAEARKPVRVYIDGCFDMMHYGHSNAIRQAKACGDVLVVGLVNDEHILQNKGSAPVMTHDERYVALEACKWVDEIIPNVPYDLSKEWVDGLVHQHKIDFIIHGDDPCFTADGTDAYAYAKQLGVYKQVKRTEGVSTTDIVGRMLHLTEEHSSGEGGAGGSGTLGAPARSTRMRAALSCLPTASAKFLPTARRIMQFADGRVPKPGDTVVYLSGGWDLLNAGHIAALKEARKLGDFVLVGIHDDESISRLRGGRGLPILNLYERALSLLSCKYVDEVILGAPPVISEDLIKTMNIAVVAKGTASDSENAHAHELLGLEWDGEDVSLTREAEYAVPAALGILRTFTSPSPTTALSIVERILAQRAAFQARYESKSAKETAYYSDKKEYIEEA